MAESAVVVLVRELEPVVGEWYRRHTEAGRRGLPPHLTLLYPFLDTDELGEEPARRLIEALRPFSALTVTFAETARFHGEEETLYLRPDPTEPFLRITEALAAAFPDHPPYGGAVDEIVPHLTVAQGSPPLLDPIERTVRARLPVTVRVERVWLVVDTAAGWRRRSAVPLF
jgi:2'-5' RNA ligase